MRRGWSDHETLAAKGFVPVEMMQDESKLALLPTNWREHAMTGAKPEWPEKPKAKAAAASP